MGLLTAALVGAAAGGRADRRDRWGTVWLCRPGIAANPCESSLVATAIAADGSQARELLRPPPAPRVDCFYVYPTVSAQPGVNANLEVGPEEVAVATAQAARFSEVCRVFAPVYRQLTLKAILAPGGISPRAALLAYGDIAAAFHDYLAHYNGGRGIVFVGHSQGSAMLIALLKREVDGSPAARTRLVSALLLGGNVTVAKGKDEGGSFAHIPACRTRRQTGCVVAYSSFSGTPPANSKFGRVGTGLLPAATGAAAKRLQVLCVNPAAPAGGPGALRPYFPTTSVQSVPGGAGVVAGVGTPWVSFPGELGGRCETSSGATWLQVDRVGGPDDRRPAVPAIPDATWGLHVADVNLALGNLVALVGEQAAAYRR